MILHAPISSRPPVVLHQERFHSNIAKAPNGERVIAFKGDPQTSLAGLLAKGLTATFDAVFVDASHEVSNKQKKLARRTRKPAHRADGRNISCSDLLSEPISIRATCAIW